MRMYTRNLNIIHAFLRQFLSHAVHVNLTRVVNWFPLSMLVTVSDRVRLQYTAIVMYSTCNSSKLAPVRMCTALF